MQNLVKNLFGYFGFTLYKRLPFGSNPFSDIEFRFGKSHLTIVFDVGANLGQSVHAIKEVFPSACIHCFEPFANTFKQLKKNTASINSVVLHPYALGARQENLDVNVSSNLQESDNNSLIHQNYADESTAVESIQIKMLDKLCEEMAIGKIDYLKIDTEGYDLEVLKGSKEMLTKKAIQFIEVEVSMNPDNTKHVPIETVKAFLEPFGYRVYGVYEQVHDYVNKLPLLRRANIVFIQSI